jgi:hypothetical protein
MSIFCLFKSAVVLSIVLYFEGCGGGPKDKAAEIKSRLDKELEYQLRKSKVPGPAEKLARAAVEDVKSQVDEMAAEGKVPSDHEVGEMLEKALTRQMVNTIQDALPLSFNNQI